MANFFEMVGKLNLGKESDKFKPVETKTSTKGWKSTRLKFSLGNDTGFHNMELFEGFFENRDNIVYCLGKDKVNGKFPKMQVKWEDRLKLDVIDKVAGFNKYKIVIDGVVSEYIAGIDFVEHVVRLLKDEKYKDKLFKVSGNREYNEWNGNTYKKNIPNYIEMVSDDTPKQSLVTLDLFFTNDAVDDSMVQDNGKYLVNAWVRQYDGTVKKEIAFKEQVVIDTSKATDDKQKRAFEMIKNRFIVTDDKFYKLGVKCVAINGVEKIDIIMDDLTEEEKELIEVGLTTFEELQKEYGGKNGDRISESKVIGFSKGYNKGPQLTDYDMNDFVSADVTDELTMVEEETEIDDSEDLPF